MREGSREGCASPSIRLGASMQEAVTVAYRTRESRPVSAGGADFSHHASLLVFQPRQTERGVAVRVYDDGHDDGARPSRWCYRMPRERA